MGCNPFFSVQELPNYLDDILGGCKTRGWCLMLFLGVSIGNDHRP